MKCFKLDVWQKSKNLSVDIYRYFADCRDFGFKDQITRSSLSIPSNIAEGAERKFGKEKRYLLGVAKGSCAELFTQIQIGVDVGYIEVKTGNRFCEQISEISAMLGSLIRHVTNNDID